jgi:hypothetical protein
MSKQVVYLSIMANGLVRLDGEGKLTFNLTRESAERRVKKEHQERLLGIAESNVRRDDDVWEYADPIDQVVAGVLSEDGVITLDDGTLIDVKRGLNKIKSKSKKRDAPDT